MMIPTMSIWLFNALVVAVGAVAVWYVSSMSPAESPSKVKPLTAAETLDRLLGRAIALEQRVLPRAATTPAPAAAVHAVHSDDDDGGFKKVA